MTIKVLYQGREIEVELITRFIRYSECACKNECDCGCCGYYKDYYKSGWGELLEKCECSLIMEVIESNQI